MWRPWGTFQPSLPSILFDPLLCCCIEWVIVMDPWTSYLGS
jgi:hypothetical protein